MYGQRERQTDKQIASSLVPVGGVGWEGMYSMLKIYESHGHRVKGIEKVVDRRERMIKASK